MVESLDTGTFIGHHINKNGVEVSVKFYDVLLVPSFWANLFSITKATSKPHCKIICEDNLITVNTNQQQLHFTQALPHGDGKIMATEFYTNTDCANLVMSKTTYNDLHDILGHPNKQSVISTAKYYGIQLNDSKNFEQCVDYRMSKIRVKNFGHNKEHQATRKGERIFIDISSVPHKSFGGAKFWFLIQADYTSHIWSYFLSSKSEVSKVLHNWIKLFQKQHCTTMKYIRCDNAGENQKLQQDIESEKDITAIFDFTAPSTPQQNGKLNAKLHRYGVKFVQC
jgi:hypothetical protein